VRRQDRSSAAQSPADATKSAAERHVAGLKPTRLLPQRLFSPVKARQERPILQEMRSQWRQAGPFVVNVAYVAVRYPANGTVCSRYKRQLIQLNMNKKWPTYPRIDDSRPIFSCSRFSYNENTLYQTDCQKSLLARARWTLALVIVGIGQLTSGTGRQRTDWLLAAPS